MNSVLQAFRAIGAGVLVAVVAATSNAAEPPVNEERQRVIVMLRVEGTSGSSLERRVAAIASVRDQVLERFRDREMTVQVRWNAVPGFAATVTPETLRQLTLDPDVASVEPDRPGEGALAQSVPLIHGDVVRNLGFTGSGVTVAILDSGVLRTHSDLSSALVAEACFCTNADGTGCCPNGATSQFGTGAANDDNGHGTNVAGIVASRGQVSSYGVATGASIIAVKVLDSTNSFNTSSQVISGLDWIISNHPEVRVVNMSLGTNAKFSGTCDASASPWASSINTLKQRGTVIVASSGNESSATMMRIPACVANTIAVGAVYDSAFGTSTAFCTDTTAADKITCFSNASTALDLLAPGAAITSDGNGGGVSTYYGTSQASPHVAGAAAVLMQVDSALTPDQIESTLKSTGVPIFDSRNSTTYPRINLQAAYNAVPCRVTVLSPNGGESLAAGQQTNITWQKNSSPNCGSSVKIDLYRSGTFDSAITASTPNNGSYSWTVASNATGASDYTVVVTDTSNASVNDASNATFTIAVPCILTMSFPRNTDTFLFARSYNIVWSHTTACGANVKFELYKGGSLHSQITASAPNNGSYAWVPTNALPPAADYRIKVTDLSTSATVFSEASFTITDAPLGLTASYNGVSQTNLVWTSPGTAGQYRVMRRDSSSGGLVQLATTNNTSYIDTNVQAGRAYVYAVQRFDSYGNLSASSNLDAALAMALTDDPLVAGTIVKRVHVTELRAAVNALRATAGLTSFNFTDETPQSIRAFHVNELRTAMAEARASAGLTTITYTEGVNAGGPVKASHLSQIRAGVQ
jgi:hypothetical protein